MAQPSSVVAPAPRPVRKVGLSTLVVAMIAGTIALEGGYVNNPADPGGETNMGVTKRVAVANGYTGPMRTLPREIVNGIYFDRYIVEPGYLPLVAIDAPVTEEVFDTAVNMGPPKSSRFLQASINDICGARLAVDGRVGPATVDAYRACQTRRGASPLCLAMLDRLDGKQRAEYDRLVRASDRYRIFYRGWIAKRIGNVDRRKCTVAA
ncbi:glycoside hydrolase family 108 protein [Sphingomonas melonis]|uniref:glycoside hydrolase family 108 protein n=1 Tax=Sphingomonas melonis TaxID=152682 RepID=UPI0035C852E0